MLPLDSFDRNNKMVEMCYKTHTTTINPIIDWNDAEVWEFIHEYKVPYCHLYDEGFKRLGCIGCPMGSKEQRIREFERYPKYKALYMKAFEKMIEHRNRGGVSETTSRRTQNKSCKDTLQKNIGRKIGGVISFILTLKRGSEIFQI